MRKCHERSAEAVVRSGGARSKAALAALLVLAWGAVPVAKVGGDPAGPLVSDFLATWLVPDQLEANSIQFGAPDVPPIPADFFGPGSDPFVGLVPFEGNPLDPGITGNASVQMRRSGDPVLPADPPGAVGMIPIELISLELRSIAPITVTFNGGQNPEQWDIDITLSNADLPKLGFLTATKAHANGGTFTADFFVQPVFIFTKVADPDQMLIIDTFQRGLPPNHLVIAAADFVHEVNPALDIILPSGLSEWVPGVQETVHGDINSQVASPFTALSDGGGITHTVCPATLKEGRCEVVSKDIPKNQSGCMTAAWPPPAGPNRRVFVSFEMDARFRDNCSCCDYRQLVKGEFKVKGKKVPLLMNTGVVLSPDELKEDGFGVPTPAGSNPHYGHRDEDNNPAHDRYSNPANRATGCNYDGTDFPGLRDLRPGTAYSFSLEFVGFIEDTCNMISLLPAHHWSVTCAGNALGPDPEPLVEVLIETTINGRGAILGVYLYPGDIVTVVGSISNGLGKVPIDASEVDIEVLGLTTIETPPPGALVESQIGGVTSHAVYDFDFPPGSPQVVHVTFIFGPETQEFDVDVSLLSPADLTGPAGVPDGCVDAFDLGAMLGAWCSSASDPDPLGDEDPPCEDCTSPNFALADISGAANVPDGCVDAFDLAKLLAAWCSVAGGNPCGTCGP